MKYYFVYYYKKKKEFIENFGRGEHSLSILLCIL